MRGYGHDVLEYMNDNREASDLGGATSALRCIWSRDDYRALRQLIREFTPDVMHVQNFFPLISLAAYYAAAAENVPVVQALQNYRFAKTLPRQLLQSLSQRSVANDDQVQLRVVPLDYRHDSNQILTTLLFNEPADKEDNGLTPDHRVSTKNACVDPNVVNGNLVLWESLLQKHFSHER